MVPRLSNTVWFPKSLPKQARMACQILLACLLFLAGGVPEGVALDWQAKDGYRVAELSVPGQGRAGFTLLAAGSLGIFFTNVLSSERALTNQIYMSGAGVALGDVDGDGWVDIYLCGIDRPNALYRNLGQWKFEDITARAGVACADQASTGAVLADVDGDGDLDLLVSGIGHGVRLFLNDGKGHFTEATRQAGLEGTMASMSMTLADIDGDGTLDLYVANYRASTLQDEPGLRFRVSMSNNLPRITMVDGKPAGAADLERYTVDAETRTIRENGEADVLYRNNGAGKFTPVPWETGAFLDEDGKPSATPHDWGLSAMFRDLNNDGLPDLYVCNDGESPDRIWINLGKGRFQAMSRLALRHTSLSSMGIDFADLNRDGLDEFFVADMLSRDHATRHQLMVDRRPPHPPGVIANRPQYMRNMVYLNRGDGTYAEIAQLSGLEASDWSWMPLFLDVDLDGYEDLLVVTGLERSLRDADARARIETAKAQSQLSKREFLESRKMMPRLDSPNFAFHNRGDLTFEDASSQWGFNSRQVSQGMAVADLDNDGVLDLVINCLNAPPLIYRNGATAPRVGVRLAGRPPNTRGIGAKIRVTGGPVAQSQEMICGGRYLSGDDAMRVFAAGALSNRLTIEVTWRSGRRSVVSGARPNCIYEISETGAAEAPVSKSPVATSPHFRDASETLGHKHHQEAFNDFERQMLLPKQLSQLGPGVSWCDLYGSGWDDLVVGCGRGGELGVFTNDRKGGFAPVALSKASGRISGDVTTILGAPEGPGASSLLAAISNYERGSTDEPSLRQFGISAAGMEAGPTIPGHESSVGPMAMADLAGDGHLTLFMGGRVLPGKYPAPASSYLYRKAAAEYRLDEVNSKQFERLGLVSGAVFSDLDGDGLPELILACEWGPIRIFRNDHGRLQPWDPPVVPASGRRSVLSQLTGWWNGVTTGDFDGDGRMDIIAGNWGRNSKYQYYAAQPQRIYYGDLTGGGAMEVVEAHYDPVLQKEVPWRHWDTLSRAMPFIRERFVTFKAYSTAGVAEILGEQMKQAQELSANTLESMVFLNRGDHFEAKPLPLEAQLAPVFAVNAADLDGDGTEDVFLSQNFFGVDAETSRYDAGRGLWLKGDGHGGFTPVSGAQSGLLIYGEQRGAALGDYDADGRMDLVVTQNGAETKLFHNEAAKPGLRVRLRGPAGNPAGFGAVIRLDFGEALGAAREIHAGSGYWSQDSAVQVMATPESPKRIRVRWPGGKTITTDIPNGAKEIAVSMGGH